MTATYREDVGETMQSGTNRIPGFAKKHRLLDRTLCSRGRPTELCAAKTSSIAGGKYTRKNVSVSGLGSVNEKRDSLEQRPSRGPYDMELRFLLTGEGQQG